jgi:hypothetical protein
VVDKGGPLAIFNVKTFRQSDGSHGALKLRQNAMQVSLEQLGAEPGNYQQISDLLTEEVEELIRESMAEQQQQPVDPASEPLGPENSQEMKTKLPLIRLRVDYTGFSTIHSQRFGNAFKDKVANPGDILLWSKSAAPRCAFLGFLGLASDMGRSRNFGHAWPRVAN